MDKNTMQNFISISFKEYMEVVGGILWASGWIMWYSLKGVYKATKDKLETKADKAALTEVKTQLENFIKTHEDKHMVLDARLEATLEKIHTKMDEGFKDVRETLNALTVAVKVTDKLLNKAD